MSRRFQEHSADLIILGGGCAGLSLASRLARQSPDQRIIILEPRTHYSEDRTWCGWRLSPHPFSDCAVAQWNRWRVHTSLGNIERGSSRYPYEMVRSDLFYRKACTMLSSAPSVKLLQGTTAMELSEAANHVRIEVEDGRSFTAPYVVDTRPPQTTLGRPWLWQNFVGYVVTLDKPVGDNFADVPTLMDFQSAGDCVAQFMYIIPAGNQRFLCEWTQFAREPADVSNIAAKLEGWLNAHSSRWSSERRESGSLPMALFRKANSRRVFPAGTRGGSMRASTGYAFHSIQRWADFCAASIAATGVPTAPQRNTLLEAMDILFLHVLGQRTASAERLFGALFRGAPPDSLVRFLAGKPETSDLWPVVRDLPWSRFIRALPSGALTWFAS